MRLLIATVIFCLAGVGFGARLELVTSVPLERARYVDFQGDHAWVAQNIEGAALLNIADPAAPRVVRQFLPEEMQPLHFRILPDEDLMISADRFRGLVIYDISTPDAPTTVSVLPLPGMTTHLDLAETTDGLRIAIMARAGEGIICVDITDPGQPRLTDHFTTGIDFSREVAVADGIVYLADSRDGGLKALRIVSPGRLEPLYQANLFGGCWSLHVHGGQLLAGYFNHGFRIFNLPDKQALADATTTPVLSLISTVLRNRSMVRGIAPVGPHLVIANEQIGIDLYNVENSALPWLSDEYHFKAMPGMEAQSCAVYRNTIYVPAWEAGLMVFRISDEPMPDEFNLENLNYAEPEH